MKGETKIQHTAAANPQCTHTLHCASNFTSSNFLIDIFFFLIYLEKSQGRVLKMISCMEYFPHEEKLNKSAPLGKQRTKSQRYIKHINYAPHMAWKM